MAKDETAAMSLEALQTLLETAHELAASLCDDGQRERLLRAFLAFPESERDAILQILEKEAAWRRIASETERTTGIAVQPNPRASLYLHVVGKESAPVNDAAGRDFDVIRSGIHTFVRLVPFFFQESVHAQWTEVARALARTGDAELRRAVVRLAGEVIELIASVGEEAPAEPAPPRRASR